MGNRIISLLVVLIMVTALSGIANAKKYKLYFEMVELKQKAESILIKVSYGENYSLPWWKSTPIKRDTGAKKNLFIIKDSTPYVTIEEANPLVKFAICKDYISEDEEQMLCKNWFIWKGDFEAIHKVMKKEGYISFDGVRKLKLMIKEK